jgi:Protein of unknown function (DUF4231)
MPGNIPSFPPPAETDTFSQVEAKARSLEALYVQTRIDWYERHSFWPRIYFRLAGIVTIIFSVSLPAVATATFGKKDIVISVMSVVIAALTGLSSFFRWENTWRKNRTAQTDLQKHVAKWELELTNARLLVPDDQRATHIYQATNDLLVNAGNVVSSESEGFFSNLQFPQQNTTTNPPGAGPGR